MKKKNIIIIGGTGFIGNHLINRLIKKKNYKVFSISSKIPSKLQIIKNVNYLICDITKKKKLKPLLDKIKIDYVINLAGYVDHKNKVKTYNSHYVGCKNLINILLKKKIIKFIQIGSSVEYGFQKSPQKEKLFLKPNNLKSTYGQAKLKASNLLIKHYKQDNFPAVILRLYIAFGPYQKTKRMLPDVINSCLENKKFDCSHGNQIRDFIFINDLIDVIIKCLRANNVTGEIFNVGSGKPRKIKNVIKLITKKTSGGTPCFGKLRLRKDEPLKLYPDISKLIKFLKWKPKVSFEIGLNKTINHYKNEKI